MQNTSQYLDLSVPQRGTNRVIVSQEVNERTVEHDDLMRRVDIEIVIERERDRIVIEGGIGGGVVGGNRRLSKTGDHLLDIAYALHA